MIISLCHLIKLHHRHSCATRLNLFFPSTTHSQSERAKQPSLLQRIKETLTKHSSHSSTFSNSLSSPTSIFESNHLPKLCAHHQLLISLPASLRPSNAGNPNPTIQHPTFQTPRYPHSTTTTRSSKWLATPISSPSRPWTSSPPSCAPTSSPAKTPASSATMPSK